MTRIAFRLMARLLVFVALAFCMPSDIHNALAQASDAYALVDAVNNYRESLGLSRLPTSDALMVAAQRHAEWMAANHTFSHTGAGGTSPQARAAAAGFGGTVLENIAGGTNATPAWVVNFWDQTYIHQVAMRDASATHLGAGFAVSGDQRAFVLLIGGASAQPPPPPQPAPNSPSAVTSTQPEVGGSAGSQARGAGSSGASAQAARIASIDAIRLAEPAEDGSIVHVVEAGQTAWAIATRYEVDLHELMALNRLTENSVLQPGDRLIIRPGAAPPSPTAPMDYTVRANDSLWIIAARANISVEDLLAWNNLSEQDVIQPGDVLMIAPPTPVPTATSVPAATPTSTPSPTATVLPTATPAPTLPPPTEVAQAATPVPATPEETNAAAQPNVRFLAMLLLAGIGVIGGAALGIAALWFVLARRRRNLTP